MGKSSLPSYYRCRNFEAKVFNPNDWKSDYPNAAFDNRLPGDTFWGARQVMALREDQIRGVVETGEYSDPEVAGYITRILMQRREKIARVFFNRVLPPDRFRITNEALEFEDLAAQYNVARLARTPYNGLVLTMRPGRSFPYPEERIFLFLRPLRKARQLDTLQQTFTPVNLVRR